MSVKLVVLNGGLLRHLQPPSLLSSRSESFFRECRTKIDPRFDWYLARLAHVRRDHVENGIFMFHLTDIGEILLARNGSLRVSIGRDRIACNTEHENTHVAAVHLCCPIGIRVWGDLNSAPDRVDIVRTCHRSFPFPGDAALN